MIDTGYLVHDSGQYVYRIPSRNLVIRGAHPEWVLMAAAEVLCRIARAEADCELAELAAARGETASGLVAGQAAEALLTERFDLLPQCIVSLGPVYYKWTDLEGRSLTPQDFMAHAMKRLIDRTQKRTVPKQLAQSSLAAGGAHHATMAGFCKISTK